MPDDGLDALPIPAEWKFISAGHLPLPANTFIFDLQRDSEQLVF